MRTRFAPKLRVPEVLADDAEAVQILEDFGTMPLSEAWLAATPAGRRELLVEAARAAAAVATTDDPGVNPPFSAEFFEREIHRSREAVFDRHLRQPLSPAEQSCHDAFAASISREIAGHPRTLVHRDFHGDNLFVLGSGSIGIIDFQDARSGPDSYDIASLCRERATLLRPDAEAESAASSAFTALARPAEGLAGRIERVRLQRAWKACGSFAAAAAAGDESARPYGEFLRSTMGLVAKLLAREGPEAEFRTILLRRSVKLGAEGR